MNSCLYYNSRRGKQDIHFMVNEWEHMLNPRYKSEQLNGKCNLVLFTKNMSRTYNIQVQQMKKRFNSTS